MSMEEQVPKRQQPQPPRQNPPKPPSEIFNCPSWYYALIILHSCPGCHRGCGGFVVEEQAGKTCGGGDGVEVNSWSLPKIVQLSSCCLPCTISDVAQSAVAPSSFSSVRSFQPALPPAPNFQSEKLKILSNYCQKRQA